jgi:hypothetical protein
VTADDKILLFPTKGITMKSILVHALIVAGTIMLAKGLNSALGNPLDKFGITLAA